MTSSAYEVAVSLSNDTYDATARQGAANEVDSIFNQIIDLANSQIEGRYIMSGFRTKTKPFALSASGVNYAGDRGVLQLEMESSTKVDVNLIGSDALFKPLSILGEKADLKAGIDASTLLADLALGNGIDLTAGTFTVKDNNLGLNITVDISTATTLGDVITLVNNQLTAGGVTNLTLALGPDGNNLMWKTTNTGQIAASTLLSNLNNGTGVDRSVGKILIHDAANTISVEVDLKSAADIGDVIRRIINTALATAGVSNVSAAINGVGNGISLTDTNGTPLGLMIEEVSPASSTAADLGILGYINPVLNGGALNPRLDFSAAESASGQTTAQDLGLIGDFSSDKAGTGLTPIILASTSLSLLNNGKGLDLGQIQISKGRSIAYLDLSNSAYQTVGDLINAINSCGLDITASINTLGKGIQIIPNTNDSTFMIEEIGNGRTAHNLGIFGSSDLLGSLMILSKALRANDREITGQLIGNLDQGMQILLNTRAGVGAKVIRLETTDTRLSDLDYNFNKLLSEVEDADLTKVATDLAMQENAYNSALIATSKVIQPSLLDFLK